MPVNIPRLRQIEQTADLTPSTRLRGSIKEQAGAISGKTQAINKVAQTGADIYKSYEDDKINQIGYELERDYKEWDNVQLQKLKTIKGDPTEPYAEYDEEKKKKYNELINRYPDASERVKRNIETNFGRSMDSYHTRSLRQRGMQEEVYKNNVYAQGLKLKQQNLAFNISEISAGKKGLYDKTLKDIEKVIAQRGLSNGTVKALPEGSKEEGDFSYRGSDGEVVKVKYTELGAINKNKAVSDALSFSIGSAIDSGEIGKATLAYDRYADKITDPKQRQVIDNKFKNYELKIKSKKMAEAILRISDKAAQRKAIAKITDSDTREKVADKVIAFNNDMESLKKTSQNSSNERFHETLDQYEKQMKAQGKTVSKLSELLEKPEFGNIWDRMSENQKKAVRNEFNPPSESDPVQAEIIQDAIYENPQDYTPAQFKALLLKQTATHRNKYLGQFSRAKKQENKDIQAKIKQASEMMKHLLAKEKIIELDEKGKVYHLSNAREKKYANIYREGRDAIGDYLEGIGPDIKKEELKELVEKFVTEGKRTQLFGSKGIFGIGADPTWSPYNRAIPRVGNPFKDLANGDDFYKLQEGYKKKFGLESVPLETDESFKEYARQEIESGRRA